MSARYPADRNPMSSARRDHIHGKLLPMDRPATAWDLFKFGLPGGIAMAALFAVATVAFVGLGL